LQINDLHVELLEPQQVIGNQTIAEPQIGEVIGHATEVEESSNVLSPASVHMNTLLLGGVAGLLMSLWQQIQTFAHRLKSLVIVTVNVEDQLCPAISNYCWGRLKRNSFGDRRYETRNAFVKPKSRSLPVAYESFGKDAVLFWIGWRPLLIAAQIKKDNEIAYSKFTMSFLRGTIVLDQFLIECLDLYNEQVENRAQDRFFVRRIIGKRNNDSKNSTDPEEIFARLRNPVYEIDRVLKWDRDDLGQPKAKDPLEGLAFPEEIKELVCEFKRWKESEKWFKEKQIPWRRGWLLYGKPGTGKTSLVRACGQVINIPVFSYDLASLSNEELIQYWRGMMSAAPCIALFEDIDTVFHLRTNVLGEKSELSFDCLLNCLSGVEPAHGIFTVVTTDDVSKIDPALGFPKNGMSTRPGRLDRAIELKELDESSRRKIAERILSEYPQEINGAIVAGDGDTGAQFQERCAQIALKCYW
jgi:SpoVK/Ycf46/Vps4 family AAA+-type ATPase